mmetsp:Transcript_25079/g.40178  ORF Transcript_25079/g.40178 Transcript_25079/m.40178 type:complete len:125 (-) Transcript_25079:181-555(-)
MGEGATTMPEVVLTGTGTKPLDGPPPLMSNGMPRIAALCRMAPPGDKAWRLKVGDWGPGDCGEDNVAEFMRRPTKRVADLLAAGLASGLANVPRYGEGAGEVRTTPGLIGWVKPGENVGPCTDV